MEGGPWGRLFVSVVPVEGIEDEYNVLKNMKMFPTLLCPPPMIPFKLQK